MKIKAYPTELFTSNYQSFDVIGKGREHKIRHEALCFKKESRTKQVLKCVTKKKGVLKWLHVLQWTH